MDILALLTDNPDQLLNEEIEMLKEELAIGEYDAAYREKCKLLISDVLKKRKHAKASASGIAVGGPDKGASSNRAKPNLPSGVSGGVLVSADKLSPFNDVNVPEKSPFETVSADVTVIRRSEKSKSLFRQYVKEQPLMEEGLIDAHYSFFEDWEIAILLGSIQFSEPFLEKYFDALDSDLVARKQLFSEDFFMKHYGDLGAESVLKKGKNPWRGKADRSKKLDMFLRLKGVQF